MKEINTDIINNLCRIAGVLELDNKFGEPFIQAFERFVPQSHNEVLIASYTCSLFLSVIFNKFPTDKLNTFVHFAKEHYNRFSFNCKMYEEIFSHISNNSLKRVALLDDKGNIMHRECTKQDIFEAFDFYTNI